MVHWLIHLLFVLSPSAKQPPTPSAPVVVSEVTGKSVFLKCSFSSSSNSSLGYVVAWSRLSPEGRKEELKQETTLQTFAFIELDGFNLRLGDKVCCRSSMCFTCSFKSGLKVVSKDKIKPIYFAKYMKSNKQCSFRKTNTYTSECLYRHHSIINKG